MLWFHPRFGRLVWLLQSGSNRLATGDERIDLWISGEWAKAKNNCNAGHHRDCCGNYMQIKRPSEKTMYPTSEGDRAFFFRNRMVLLRLHLQIGDKGVLCGLYRAIVCSTPAVTARQCRKVTKIPLFVLLYCEGKRPPLMPRRYHSTPLRQGE